MTTGVYIIANLENGNVYIGSAAVSFVGRLGSHRSNLRNGKHPNRHLQSAWNKYGEDAFVFQPLEETLPDSAVRLEQIYIDAWKPAYNMSPTAGSVLGTKHSVEAIAKMKVAFARPEFKARQRETMKEIQARPEYKVRQSEATKERMNRPEARARISEMSKEVHARPEVKAKTKATRARPEVKARMSAAAKAASARPEVKARRSAASKEMHARPEVKARHREAMKAVRARPEVKAKMKVALNRPEVKERMYARQRKPVVAICVLTGELKQYVSLTDAALQLGCGTGSICCALKGRVKTCAGHAWAYAT